MPAHMRSMLATLIAPLLAVVCTVGAAATVRTADEVTSLPGLPGKLSSRHYSGFLNASGARMHYWMMESEHAPATDPIILW